MALFDRFKKKSAPDGEKKQEKKEEKAEKNKEAEKEGKKAEKKAEGKIIKSAEKKRLVCAYQVIKKPHITEKATDLTEISKYIFKVYPKANKIQIKRAVESLYGVKVDKVNIIHSSGKRRRLGQSEGWKGGLSKGFKKAIVSLAKGEKIEIIPR